MVNSLGGSHSMKDVIKKQKEIESGLGKLTVEQDEAFQKFMSKMHKDHKNEQYSKLKNMTPIQIEEYLKEEEKAHKHREVEEENIKLAAAQRAREQQIELQSQMEEKERVKQAKLAEKEKKKNETKGTISPAKGSPLLQATVSSSNNINNNTAISSTAENDSWSADEQQKLELALKSVGKDAADRWEQIAAKVGTKSKKQCIARFKFIRDEILKKQGK
jgi:hypothetical protein